MRIKNLLRNEKICEGKHHRRTHHHGAYERRRGTVDSDQELHIVLRHFDQLTKSDDIIKTGLHSKKESGLMSVLRSKCVRICVLMECD